MEDNLELTPRRIGAIRRSAELGRTLQKEHPEIEIMYGYYPLMEIVKRLDISLEYDVNKGVALAGVHKAIAGYNEGLGIEGYVGLIPKEEREWLGREHKFNGGHKSHNEKKGIHKLTTKEKRAIGYKLHIEKKGIHGRSPEQMREDGIKGNRESMRVKGLIPWTNEEKELIYQLSLNPEYQNGSRTNNLLITIELNKRCHEGEEIRNVKSVGAQLYRIRKSLEKMVE
jgi:hypothetical protein